MAKAKYEKWLTPEGLTLLGGWARRGLTDEQIAKNMGISRSTLSEWKLKYPDISDTLKKGKEVIDTEVENALLKRALGYKYEEKSTTISDKDGVKVTTTKKELPPDTTAQIFWLKNRCPDLWRESLQQKEEQQGDGFMEALNSTAREDWDGDE